jgi:hypothetical protein
MMEAESTSETSVNFYQNTRRNNPEDSYLHTRRRENLKSHIVIDSFFSTSKWLAATYALLWSYQYKYICLSYAFTL